MRSGRPPAPPGLRPVQRPRPLQVRTDGDGRPVAVRGRRGRVAIAGIREEWRIDDEWWRRPISRSYYDVILETGRAVTLYRDEVEERWYLQ